MDNGIELSDESKGQATDARDTKMNLKSIVLRECGVYGSTSATGPGQPGIPVGSLPKNCCPVPVRTASGVSDMRTGPGPRDAWQRGGQPPPGRMEGAREDESGRSSQRRSGWDGRR